MEQVILWERNFGEIGYFHISYEVCYCFLNVSCHLWKFTTPEILVPQEVPSEWHASYVKWVGFDQGHVTEVLEGKWKSFYFSVCLDNNRAHFTSMFGLRHRPCEVTHLLLVDNSVAHHCYIFALCQTLQKNQAILGKAYSMLSSKVVGDRIKCLYSGS